MRGVDPVVPDGEWSTCSARSRRLVTLRDVSRGGDVQTHGESKAATELGRMTGPTDPALRAQQDGPNTHKYHDAGFVTSWTLFDLYDPEGERHIFHVPTRIVEQIETVEVAALAAAEAAPLDANFDKAAEFLRGWQEGYAQGTAEAAPLDVDTLWTVLAGIGVIANGTWVAFTREDAVSIAETYAALRSLDTETAERRCVECGEPWPCPATIYGDEKKTPHRIGFPDTETAGEAG
jgi:hypothetical protein